MILAEYMQRVDAVNRDPDLSGDDRVEIQRKLATEVEFETAPKILFQGEAVARNGLVRQVKNEEE
jgi:hypothetical protein